MDDKKVRFEFNLDKILGAENGGVMCAVTVITNNSYYPSYYFIDEHDVESDLISVDDDMLLDFGYDDLDNVSDWTHYRKLFESITEWIQPMRKRILSVYLSKHHTHTE